MCLSMRHRVVIEHIVTAAIEVSGQRRSICNAQHTFGAARVAKATVFDTNIIAFVEVHCGREEINAADSNVVTQRSSKGMILDFYADVTCWRAAVGNPEINGICSSIKKPLASGI